MSPLSRLLTFSLVVLLALISAGLGAQAWFHQQELRMVRTARVALSQQLEAAIAVTGGEHAQWSNERLRLIAATTGAELVTTEAEPPTLDHLSDIQIVRMISGDKWLVAAHPAAASAQIHRLLQRVILSLGVFAVLLVAALLFVLAVRPLRDRETRAPFIAQSQDMRSLSFLARTSVRQQAELDQERDERLRAEADARQRLQLLNQALEEKIGMGRDLHDGVIQSLYAAGLNLQAAQQLAPTDAEKAGERVESAVQLIHRTIVDIRSYIAGLSPRRVRQQTLAQALSAIVEELRAGRLIVTELKIDEQASTALSDGQVSESMQIVREGVSNALRHGGAQSLVINLTLVATGVELLLKDDGAGFEISKPRGEGHGLANMQARAQRGGGTFTIQSTPGEGSTIKILWRTEIPS